MDIAVTKGKITTTITIKIHRQLAQAQANVKMPRHLLQNLLASQATTQVRRTIRCTTMTAGIITIEIQKRQIISRSSMRMTCRMNEFRGEPVTIIQVAATENTAIIEVPFQIAITIVVLLTRSGKPLFQLRSHHEMTIKWMTIMKMTKIIGSGSIMMTKMRINRSMNRRMTPMLRTTRMI